MSAVISIDNIKYANSLRDATGKSVTNVTNIKCVDGLV